MTQVASLRSCLVSVLILFGSALSGVAQTAPPKEITFEVFSKGGVYSPASMAVPPPKPVEILPGSTVIRFPDGSAAIENPSPLPSLPLPANTVPFTLTTSGQILLTVRVGAHSLHLALDTGASSTGLLPASAATLKVRAGKTARAVPNVKFGTLSEITLGDITLNDVPVAITEMAALNAWNGQHPDETIDGVLGIDTLQQWAIGLDLLARTITFWKGGHVGRDQIIAFQTDGLQRYARLPEHQQLIKISLAAAVPMHHRSDSAEHPFYSVTVQLDGVEAEMDVDTGALISVVPGKIASGLKPLLTTRAAIRTLNGDAPTTTMALRAMKVGSLTADYPMIAAQSPAIPEEFATATLGRPFFDRCQVILDFPAATLSAARLADESQARLLLPAMGIFPNAQAQRLAVLVKPSSAAAEMGIRSGDEIVHVEETNALLPGSPQPDPSTPTDLTLMIRRAGRATPLKFSMRVLRITEALAAHEFAFPEGGRVYNSGQSGGHVVRPGSTVIPSADALLLFNTK